MFECICESDDRRLGICMHGKKRGICHKHEDDGLTNCQPSILISHFGFKLNNNEYLSVTHPLLDLPFS